MISSAVGGKRAAPKAAARRRPPTKPQVVPPADDAPAETARPESPVPEPVTITALDTTASTVPPVLTNDSLATSLESDNASRKEAQLEVSATNTATQTRSPASYDNGDSHVGSSRDHQVHEVEAGPAQALVSATRVKTGAKPTASRGNKRKSATTVVDSGQQDDVSDAVSPHSEVPQTRKRQRKAKKTKDISVGEGEDKEDENLEEPEINPANFTMFQLSYSSKRGKISEREKKMSEIDWAEVARKRQEEVERIKAGQNVDNNNADQVVESTEVADAQASATPAAENDIAETTGIRFRLVNGQIVEDETTLSIDQNAQAHANANNDDEVEEENDLTERLNRTTYLNDRRRDPRERIPVHKSKSDPWTEDETDRFYDALRMFGTDFDIISKMFPPKTRMQVKKKFNREERIDLARINAALLGKENKPMDLEHYAREVGEDVSVYMKYESYEHASQIIRESMKEREEELAAALKENTETQRQQDIQQKQQEAAEKKKAERKEKAAARRANKGKKPGVGTMGGGGPEEVVVETTEN